MNAVATTVSKTTDADKYCSIRGYVPLAINNIRNPETGKYLSGNARSILDRLLCMNEAKGWSGSVNSLAEYLNMSPSTVRRAIAELSDKNIGLAGAIKIKGKPWIRVNRKRMLRLQEQELSQLDKKRKTRPADVDQGTFEEEEAYLEIVEDCLEEEAAREAQKDDNAYDVPESAPASADRNSDDTSCDSQEATATAEQKTAEPKEQPATLTVQLIGPATTPVHTETATAVAAAAPAAMQQAPLPAAYSSISAAEHVTANQLQQRTAAGAGAVSAVNSAVPAPAPAVQPQVQSTAVQASVMPAAQQATPVPQPAQPHTGPTHSLNLLGSGQTSGNSGNKIIYVDPNTGEPLSKRAIAMQKALLQLNDMKNSDPPAAQHVSQAQPAGQPLTAAGSAPAVAPAAPASVVAPPTILTELDLFRCFSKMDLSRCGCDITTMVKQMFFHHQTKTHWVMQTKSGPVKITHNNLMQACDYWRIGAEKLQAAKEGKKI